MNKFLYKALDLPLGLLSASLAGLLVRQLWKAAGHEEKPPEATDARRGWGEILAAAALQGAVFAVVKAAVDRGTAEGVRSVTGTWPGEDGAAEAD